LDPGVHPSIFGLGEGADFFGLTKCHFLFHHTTELALWKLRDKEEVVCDITKHLPRDVGKGGSENYSEANIDTVRSEAEKVSRLSLKFPNVTGAIHDDLLRMLREQGFGGDKYAAVSNALKRHNPNLKLWIVVYAKEMDKPEWPGVEPYVDVINLWFWPGSGYDEMDRAVERCREIFKNKPIYVGCYMRNYPEKKPLPIATIEKRFEGIVRHLKEGKIAGYTILGTVLIDGQLEQAEWIRDFIAKHSWQARLARRRAQSHADPSPRVSHRPSGGDLT